MSWIAELVSYVILLIPDVWNAVVHLRSLELPDPTQNRP